MGSCEEKWVDIESGFAGRLVYGAFVVVASLGATSPTRQAIKSVDDVTLFRCGLGKQARPRRIIDDLRRCSE